MAPTLELDTVPRCAGCQCRLRDGGHLVPDAASLRWVRVCGVCRHLADDGTDPMACPAMAPLARQEGVPLARQEGVVHG